MYTHTVLVLLPADGYMNLIVPYYSLECPPSVAICNLGTDEQAKKHSIAPFIANVTKAFTGE